jgi:hypothetical protein
MRGEAKAKIRSLIVSEYKFHSSQSSKSREHNLKRAAALKIDLNFTYRVTFMLVSCLHLLTTSTGLEILQPQQGSCRKNRTLPRFDYTEGR